MNIAGRAGLLGQPLKCGRQTTKFKGHRIKATGEYPRHGIGLVCQLDDAYRCFGFRRLTLVQPLLQRCAKQGQAGKLLAQAVVQFTAHGLLLHFADTNEFAFELPALCYLAKQLGIGALQVTRSLDDLALQPGVRLSEFSLRAPLLGNRGGKQQASNCHHNGKCAPAHQTIYRPVFHKRTGTLCGTPHCQHGHRQCQQRRTPLPKSKRAPDHERKHRQGGRIVAAPGQLWRAENEVAHRAQCGTEHHRLKRHPGCHGWCFMPQPNQQSGRYDQHTHHVAQPPLDPRTSRVSHGNQTAQEKRENACECAQRGAGHGGQCNERKYIASAVQRAAKTGKAGEQPNAHHGFKGVTDRYARSHPQGHTGQGIGHKGTQRHTRHHAIAQQQKRSQCDAAGCPDKGNGTANHCLRQATDSRRHINQS